MCVVFSPWKKGEEIEMERERAVVGGQLGTACRDRLVKERGPSRPAAGEASSAPRCGTPTLGAAL